MVVTISPELEVLPYWQEIRDYANGRMAEEGWDDSIFVRPPSQAEETQFRERGVNMLVNRHADGTFELVVDAGIYLDFAEITNLDRKFGIATGRSILTYLWMAQIACMGKSLGGCDS